MFSRGYSDLKLAGMHRKNPTKTLQCLHPYLLVRARALKAALPEVSFILIPSGNWRRACGWVVLLLPLSLSLQLMSKLNKFLSLEMWIPIQRASSLHCGVDSSLIRKFLHECSCTSRLLSPGVIINAALRVQGGLGNPADRTLSLFAVQ